MTFEQVLKEGIKQLYAAGIEDAETDAWFLFSGVTGLSRAGYLLNRQEPMPEPNRDSFLKMIDRRKTHEPCQYIIGSTEFMGLTFKVTPAVLIPRQDTELLAEEAIELIHRLEKACSVKAEEKVKILDLCTGSGAIAVSLKHYCPDADVSASDISAEALAQAMENAADNQTEISFYQGDLFAPFRGQTFHVIVSNPPYVTEAEYQELMPEVKEHEPALALLAGKDGLDLYRKIIRQAGAYLKEGGHLLLEIGYAQAEAVSSLMEEDGYEEIRVLKDLAGKDRVVRAKKRSCCQGSSTDQSNG